MVYRVKYFGEILHTLIALYRALPGLGLVHSKWSDWSRCLSGIFPVFSFLILYFLSELQLCICRDAWKEG